MHLLKSQMRLKDMLMENFQKMMKFGWKRKNLRDRDGADMCSRARIKFPIVMSGQISIMDLLHQGLHRGDQDTARSTPSTPMPAESYRDQRLAGERGKAVVRHAKSEQERRGDRQAGGKRGSKGNASSSTLTTSVSIGDNENYFADSYSIAQYFDMGMVPRNEAVLDDYRWDLIMQGMGPETILVHNRREFNQIISECNDPLERLAMQRLLRHLHGLMVMFQSKDPLQWIDAAFQLKNGFEQTAIGVSSMKNQHMMDQKNMKKEKKRTMTTEKMQWILKMYLAEIEKTQEVQILAVRVRQQLVDHFEMQVQRYL